LFAFSPVACTKYPDHIIAIRKSHRENALANPAKTEMPFFIGTVGMVFRDNTEWIREGDLCLGKGYAMLILIFAILSGIPLKSGFGHVKA
jgi:hypothetical protein